MPQVIEHHLKLQAKSGTFFTASFRNLQGGLTAAKQIALNQNPGAKVVSTKTVYAKE